VTYHVCLVCAIKLGLSVRELISHSIRPFSPQLVLIGRHRG
jgi:hypothetical protein